MAPSSRLIQADFQDTDLLLADNFVRAAEAAGLTHVIYLSGLMPNGQEALSPHLRSRLEVEGVLRSRSVKVTVLRAGLIFGPGGSSFSLLTNLVRRLPVMLMPAWVRSRTHSIDIENVCQAVGACLQDSTLAGGTYDLGGHEPMTYREMILQTGRLLGKRTRYVDFPLNCFSLSKPWVSLIGGVPASLAGPLLESLEYNLTAQPNALLSRIEGGLVSFDDSFRKSVDAKGNLDLILAGRHRLRMRSESRTHGVCARCSGCHVRTVGVREEIADEYGVWLTGNLKGLICATSDDGGVVRFMAFGGRLCLLELSPDAILEG